MRELVLNAIIHRDYTSPIDLQIKIFDQSISFFNPSGLYGNLTIENLKTNNYRSSTRNKLIAEAFYLTKDIEKYGSGFIRIRKAISEYPTMEFKYNEIGNGFLTELSYTEQKITSGVPDKTPDRISDTMQKILICLEKNNRMSMTELADEIGISKRKILDNINKLKHQNLLIRIGNNKTGHWQVTNKING